MMQQIFVKWKQKSERKLSQLWEETQGKQITEYYEAQMKYPKVTRKNYN